MGLSRRKLRVLLVLGIVVGVPLGVMGAIHIQNPGQYEGQPVIGASDQGPNIGLPSGGTQADFEEFAVDGQTLRIKTDSGNGTFISQGYTGADADVLEGGWSNLSSIDVTSAELSVDPDDKRAINISGDVDQLAFRNAAIDDDKIDFVYSGGTGSTSLTVRGVEANTQITAVDQGGTQLDVASSDGDGVVTFTDMQTGTEKEVKLFSSALSINNPSPTGDLDSPPAEYNVTVENSDSDSYEANVTFYLEGTEINNQTITSDGPVTTSVPSEGQTGGEHNWSVEVISDEMEVSAPHSYRVPDTLYIRNETNTDQLIKDPINSSVRFYGDEEIHTRTTSDGTVNLTDLPVNEDFIVEIEPSDDYYSRTVFIQSIYDQQDVYLLHTNKTSISSRFVLDDPTGQFDSSTVVFLQKPVEQDNETSYRTIHADRFGSEGVTANLQKDARYRIKILSADGATQEIGPYRADVNETVTVRPGSPTIGLEQFQAGWAADAGIDNTTLEYVFSDPDSETDSVTVYVHEKENKSNQLDANRTYHNLGNLSGTYALSTNQSEKTWVVYFDVDRADKEFTIRKEVAKNPNLVPGLSDEWRLVVGIGILLISAGVFSVLNASVGGVVVAIEGGVLWWTGWLGGATTAAGVIIALFVAVIVHIYKSSGP